MTGIAIAKIKVGNVELEIPEEVSRYARMASGKSREQLLKELEETRRKFLSLKKALTASTRQTSPELESSAPPPLSALQDIALS